MFKILKYSAVTLTFVSVIMLAGSYVVLGAGWDCITPPGFVCPPGCAQKYMQCGIAGCNGTYSCDTHNDGGCSTSYVRCTCNNPVQLKGGYCNGGQVME